MELNCIRRFTHPQHIHIYRHAHICTYTFCNYSSHFVVLSQLPSIQITAEEKWGNDVKILLSCELAKPRNTVHFFLSDTFNSLSILLKSLIINVSQAFLNTALLIHVPFYNISRDKHKNAFSPTKLQRRVVSRNIFNNLD